MAPCPEAPRRPCSARSTTPAAPSPKRAADTNMATLGSFGRAHSVHRSTVRKRTFAPGLPCARRAARAKPATPPPQPSPKIGRRSMSGRKSSRFISRASRLGMASPVMVLTTSMSMSPSARPAPATALTDTSSRSASACRWNFSVRSSQPCGLLVPFTGLTAVAGLYAGVGKETVQAHEVRKDRLRALQGRVLVHLVGGIGSCHGQDLDIQPGLDLALSVRARQSLLHVGIPVCATPHLGMAHGWRLRPIVGEAIKSTFT